LQLTADSEALRLQLDKVTQKNVDVEKQLKIQCERVASVDGLVAEHQKAVASLEAQIKEMNVERVPSLFIAACRYGEHGNSIIMCRC